MRRLQIVEWQFKGGVTAFLSILFLLLLSLVGALVESASIHITKNRKRADVNLALESVFAEYHSEMLNRYDLFVHFGSEETTLKNRLEYYGAGNMSHTMKQVELLTDNGGSKFYDQAVRYTKNKLGIDAKLPGIAYEYDTDFSYEGEKDEIFGNLEGLLETEEKGLVEENNPLNWAGNMKSIGLLSFLVPENDRLSDRTIAVETLPTHRSLQKGNFPDAEERDGTDKLFFTAYLEEHFSTYMKEDTAKALLYEQEYLLGGYDSDRENLEAVCKKILNLRIVPNYTYLLSDAQKQAEAEAMAATLCALIANPEITPVVKQALLLVWAYGESMVDVRALLHQKKVPVVKTTATWQLQLANVTKLGTSEEVINEKECEGGLSYADYLKGFLFMEEKEKLCLRSLDLIEGNLHIKTDQCMTKAKIETKVLLRRGIRDTFITTFGYQ